MAKNTPLCYSCLASVYPDSVVLKVRQEHLILAELQTLCPDLENWFLAWDCPVAGGCSLLRPDMLWEMPCFYLHLEVDERGDIHEDNRQRLEIIHESMGGLRPGLVIRINTNNTHLLVLPRRCLTHMGMSWIRNAFESARMA